MSAPAQDGDAHPLDDSPRMTLAEIGGALTDDNLTHAEGLTLKLLGEIRRRKQEGSR